MHKSYCYCNKLWSRHLKVFRVSTIPSSASTIELLPTADSDKLQHDLDLMLSSLANVDTNDHLEDLNTTILQATKEEEEPGNEGYSLHEALYKLIEKIQQATQRSLDGQRVDPSSRLQHQLDIASLGALVDRMNKRRLVDQDWISNSEQLAIDITELVAKSSCFFRIAEEYDEQRYELSPIKERDLFLFHVFSKINRQSGRRMINQDAEIKPRRAYLDEESDDLISLINRVSSSNRKYTDQRATLKRRPP
ncbi:hypothetical protein V8B55DRAFT_1563716 [Mucor lusitanicus]|uniref:Uncharacterized protein n=2 Tax=Mucor circinelloides f. lusitanicus TaxID=29924 RepID=A0A168Q4N5_MUCCL|nr:hypothetical protein FB192DRAFT_1434810 [Mucor lusitanicus]OAD08688.1 hypothetical protein MUCCIDRAFT_76421 [Mucor lusitanicus CBS 277.49]